MLLSLKTQLEDVPSNGHQICLDKIPDFFLVPQKVV